MAKINIWVHIALYWVQTRFTGCIETTTIMIIILFPIKMEMDVEKEI